MRRPAAAAVVTDAHHTVPVALRRCWGRHRPVGPRLRCRGRPGVGGRRFCRRAIVGATTTASTRTPEGQQDPSARRHHLHVLRCRSGQTWISSARPGLFPERRSMRRYWRCVRPHEIAPGPCTPNDDHPRARRRRRRQRRTRADGLVAGDEPGWCTPTRARGRSARSRPTAGGGLSGVAGRRDLTAAGLGKGCQGTFLAT